MLHTVIFIGRSGCGKGTQADLLKERIHKLDPDNQRTLYVETGEHFRSFIRSKGYTSEMSKQAYDADLRQPDFLACWMWGKMLIEELEDNMHIIFDGAPRSLPEAEILSTAMEFYGRKDTVVVYLDVSRKWSEERLLARGRQDDKSLSKINKRLDWFDKEVMPAIDYFKSSSLYRVLEIDGEQTIEQVHKDIVEAYGY